MRFLELIDNICETFDNTVTGRRDKASLYGVCDAPPPLAEHIVFDPMPDAVAKCLVNDYRGVFPKELLEIYAVMNGADLFWTVRTTQSKIKIPLCRVVIYGVPLTSDRKHIEPFNISIEDLNRPAGIPHCWLKFGSYIDFPHNSDTFNLFVDTDRLNVFAVKKQASNCCVVREWESIDDCLCWLIEYFREKA